MRYFAAAPIVATGNYNKHPRNVECTLAVSVEGSAFPAFRLRIAKLRFIPGPGFRLCRLPDRHLHKGSTNFVWEQRKPHHVFSVWCAWFSNAWNTMYR